MRSRLCFACSLLLLVVAPAHAQEWAKKMFKKSSHDFGVVARGSKAEIAFEFQNIYEEDVHIAGLRSTCGCASSKATKDTLKTWDKAQVIAAYDTTKFMGIKTSTITVIFDQPFYAEVQLTIKGYIRGDVVFDPGQIDFGDVEVGSSTVKKATIRYAGRSDWKIADVRSANTHLEVELNETRRLAGQIAYEMVVRLKPDAPPGYIQDQLTLVTNDGRNRTIPLPVVGRVRSPLTVSPAPLLLGQLKSGQTASKNLVVRSKKPFKILDVQCEEGGFEFGKSDQAKTLHLIPVTYTAGSVPGKVVAKIKIQTDLAAGGDAECVATATILASSGQ